MRRIGIDGRVLVDRYHGIGRVTFELLTALSHDADLELVVFVDRREPADRLDLASLEARPSIRFVDFPVRLPSPMQFLRWPGALRREGVDAVLHPYQLGATFVGGRRRLAIVHDCVFERDPAYATSRGELAVYRLMTRALLRRADVVTPSRATADDVQAVYGVPVPDRRVIGWGVSPAFFDDEEHEGGAPTFGGPYLLHVGARRPHKNVPFLVRLLAELDESVHLVLVGSADPRWPDATIALAEQLGIAGRVHELSGVSDDELMALYANAHAFVYPSAVEGFGLPLLEAMAAGAPVVASDIPVFREVSHDAVEFAALDDTASWAAAVTRLSDPHHRRRLVRRARETARSATWQDAAARLAAVLHETSGRR